MQKVSQAYKDSMESLLRERGYIMITFGLVNQEVQSNAKIDSGDFAYFSHEDKLFQEEEEEAIYATMEENFTTADGTMTFLPHEESGMELFDSGLVSAGLVSDATYTVNINLHTAAIDFKGVTIDFGANYPVDFDLVGSTGQTVEFRDNTESKWSTEEVIENTTSLSLVVYKMKNEHSRLRIYSIMFGYGLVYYNDSVMDSSLEQYVSPISEDVPQIDFSVTLKNYDKYFNVDNPDSAINYLETGQEMDIRYGYQLPDSDTIEWVQGSHLLCSEWESDDNTATIRCQDVFRNMTTEYYKGEYKANGISYWNLAVDVCSMAGIDTYYLDPCLKTLYTSNPLPRVECKQALQIIANACRCVLTQSRDGAVQIRSAFDPDASVSSNGETSFSHVENVLNDSTKDEYGTMAQDYTVTTAGMYFVPESGEATANTGYVSSAISDENGEFTINPVVTLTMASAKAYHGLELRFGSALPAAFTIHTYNAGEWVADLEVSSGISAQTLIQNEFDDFDVMEIEFTKTAVPYNRIILNYITLRDVANFTMTRRDMLSSPKAIKQEVTKEVVVPYYSYQKSETQETLISEETTVTAGETETYYLGNASYDYSASLDDSADGVTVVGSGAYYVKLQFSVSGTYQLAVTGYRYKVVEKQVTKTLHNRGKTVKWENPLLSSVDMANDLAEWLGEYYDSNIEYEYDTRGNPELDATDIIYQANDFIDDMKVEIYRHTIGFKQAFSGQVTARRIGG